MSTEEPCPGTAAAVEANHRANRWIIRLATLVAVMLVTLAAAGFVVQLVGLERILGVARQNRLTGNLLVECVTPGPDPAPNTGHDCWDRLHVPAADAVSDEDLDRLARRLDDNRYCTAARLRAGLPPATDPSRPCREQTPPDVYPGG